MWRTLQCRIRHDQRVELILQRQFGNVADGGFVQIGRHLEKQRPPSVRRFEQASRFQHAAEQVL